MEHAEDAQKTERELQSCGQLSSFARRDSRGGCPHMFSPAVLVLLLVFVALYA